MVERDLCDDEAKFTKESSARRVSAEDDRDVVLVLISVINVSSLKESSMQSTPKDRR